MSQFHLFLWNFCVNFFKFCQFFLPKLLTLGILFSTAVRTEVVAKLVILDILFLTSFMLVSRAAVVAKLQIIVFRF